MEKRANEYPSRFGIHSGPDGDSFNGFIARFFNPDLASLLRASAEIYRDVMLDFDARAKDEDILMGRGPSEASSDPLLAYKLRGLADFVSKVSDAVKPAGTAEYDESVDSTPKKRKKLSGK